MINKTTNNTIINVNKMSTNSGGGVFIKKKI